jgi:hypothetical protein
MRRDRRDVLAGLGTTGTLLGGGALAAGHRLCAGRSRAGTRCHSSCARTGRFDRRLLGSFPSSIWGAPSTPAAPGSRMTFELPARSYTVARLAVTLR